MNRKIGEVFSIAADNAPIPGCTVSTAIHEGEPYAAVFSLAQHTDISAEIFPDRKLLIGADGVFEVYQADGAVRTLKSGECVVTLLGVPIGMRTSVSAVYTEICIGRNDTLNEVIKPGEVFKLADLVPYCEGKIVNMDVVHSDKMKFVVMAFAPGTGLTPHAAPGEALIFALDGEGVIGYEGQEYPIKAGEEFCFAKGGMHSVTAKSAFKMALFLTLE